MGMMSAVDSYLKMSNPFAATGASFLSAMCTLAS